jgi:hypothetical protein
LNRAKKVHVESSKDNRWKERRKKEKKKVLTGSDKRQTRRREKGENKVFLSSEGRNEGRLLQGPFYHENEKQNSERKEK